MTTDDSGSGIAGPKAAPFEEDERDELRRLDSEPIPDAMRSLALALERKLREKDRDLFFATKRRQ